MEGFFTPMNLFNAKPSTPKVEAPTPRQEGKDIKDTDQTTNSLSAETRPMTSTTATSTRAPSTAANSITPASEPGPSAVVGSKITFKGELSGDEDLLIQGYVEGTITLKGNQLTIGRLGKVKANISAKSIIVDGHVEGDMVAEEHIAINAQSLVKGNISAERVTLEDGAKFRGSIDMDLEDKPSTTSYKSEKTLTTTKEPEPA